MFRSSYPEWHTKRFAVPTTARISSNTQIARSRYLRYQVDPCKDHRRYLPCSRTWSGGECKSHQANFIISLHLVRLCCPLTWLFADTMESNWPVTDATGVRRIAQAVIFGLGSMFNHSAQHQNVVWERDTARMIVTYRALRDIQAGEELCGFRNLARCSGDAVVNLVRHIVRKPPNIRGC